MQREQLAQGLGAQLGGVRRLVEIEVAGERLVRALAGEHHLDAHRFDLARHQVHRRARADRGDVEGLELVDRLGQGVEAFLQGVGETVVDGAEVIGDALRLLEIR